MKKLEIPCSAPLFAVACLALAGACSDGDTAADPIAELGGSGGSATPSVNAGSSGASGSLDLIAAEDNAGGAAGSASLDGLGGTAGLAIVDESGGVAGSAMVDGSGGAAGSASLDGLGGTAGSAMVDGSGGAAGSPMVDGSGGSEFDDATVSYATDIQPILLSNCSPCHSVLNYGRHNAASSYDDAVDEADNIIDEIESGRMPPTCDRGELGDVNCLSEAELALIEQWVDDDTPE